MRCRDRSVIFLANDAVWLSDSVDKEEVAKLALAATDTMPYVADTETPAFCELSWVSTREVSLAISYRSVVIVSRSTVCSRSVVRSYVFSERRSRRVERSLYSPCMTFSMCATSPAL